jgi:thiol-disulfide isomerase/thioredoxin
MIARRLLLGLLLPLLAAAPCRAETCPEKAIERRPAAKTPAGWIMDFDYQSDVYGYLRNHYDAARNENLRLYAYVYADWCPPCRAMRAAVASHASLQQAFDGTRVLMLNFDAYNCLASEIAGRNVYPLRIVPLLIKIDPDGSFGDVVVPSLYIEHGPRAATITHIRKFLESTAD